MHSASIACYKDSCFYQKMSTASSYVSHGIKRVVELVTDPYKLANKTVGFIKATKNVVEVFTIISNGLSKFFIFLDPIKVIQIPLYSRKLCIASIKLITANDWITRSQSAFMMYRCCKKIVSGVSAGLKFLSSLDVISSNALNWTVITGYVFMPVTFISAAINMEMSRKQAILLRDFTKHANLEKQGIIKACDYFVENRKRLQNLKIVRKDKEFDVRFEKIVEKLKTGTDVEKKESEQQVRKLLCNTKWRIAECLTISVTKTSLKIAGCVVTVIGLTSGVGIIPAAFIDLSFAIGSLSLFVATKYIHSRPLLMAQS